MTGSDREYSLRPEARPIPYRKHQRRAKKALDLVIRVLNAAAKSVGESEDGGGDPNVDTNRASRIFFVSGEPGSGKSTLYLTLRAMLSPRSGNIYSDGYSDDKDALGNLRESVRLLDPLDLEVAGDEGENLLAAVLVRLFETLSDSSISSSKDCEDALKELEELATDIGIAWEGNLQARAGALDPDTYSEEVMRTQRARLGVNLRLRKALEKLAKNECNGCRKGTLFVLPVDDFYLKPDASLQLLRLLRMISIPRLFFLVMGDITTVEALFIEKSLADWTAVAGARLFPDNSDRLSQALARARELRARYLRKLLPPAQRTTIEAMDWYEALDVEVGSPDDASPSRQTLEDLLGEIRLDRLAREKGSPDTILDFLISPPFNSDEKQKRKQRASENYKDKESVEERSRRGDRAAYTALQILDATPREVMDLGSALREVRREQMLKSKGHEIDDNNAPQLLSCIMDFVNLVIDEQNFFDENEQEVLEGILPTRHYFLEDIHLKLSPLSLQPDPWPWKVIPGRLCIRKHRSWNLTVNDESTRTQVDRGGSNAGVKPDENEQSPFKNLPPRPTAWIILLHDLAWRWNRDSVTGNLIQGLCQRLKKLPTPAGDVGFSLPDDVLGWAVWREESKNVHFPMPSFETFQDCDRFLRLWNSGLEWLDEQPPLADSLKDQVASREQNLIDEYVRLWEIAGWVVINDYYEDFAREPVNRFERKQIDIFKRRQKATKFGDRDKQWQEQLGELRGTLSSAQTKKKKSKASKR